MLTQEDFFYIAQFETSSTRSHRWLAVFGTKVEAFEAGSNYIRDNLLTTPLRKSTTPRTIRILEAACKDSDHETVIATWNEAFPGLKIKVYKAGSIL